jgi:hypothetical protein
MLAPMSENRRKHPRVRATGIAAHVRAPANRFPCVVENISSGGLFVRTDRLLDIGVQLEIDLVRPGWKRPLSFFARVTSRIDPLAGRYAHRTPGMGMQFFGRMDEEIRSRLHSLLRELGAPEPAPEAARAVELEEDELAEELLLEPDLPLWQQVQQLELEGEPSSAARPSEPPHAAPAAPAPLAEPPSRPAPAANDVDRLMLQIRGLIFELNEAQQKLSQREAEVAALRSELETAHAALARVVKRS